MKKLLLASLFLLGGLGITAGSASAAPRYPSHAAADNARVECILPWYRFFGACDEAIDDYPYGNHWHDWNNHRHHHGYYRR